MTADVDEGNHNFDVYYYEKNLQGDVIAVRDENGAVRYSYLYNAWGELVYAYAFNGAENTTARYNTIFYRGYYFDEDLCLYYLTTRYYDPNIGRFISPDDISYLGANGDLNAYNLYAYCSNNPVMYSDPSGHSIIGILSGMAVAAYHAFVALITVVSVLMVVDATFSEVEKINKNKDNNNYVYVLTDDSKDVKYVGRTKDPLKRLKAHNKNPARKGLTMYIIAKDLTLEEARALEQAGMAYYNTITKINKVHNQINGINPNNWGNYKTVAFNFLNYGWNQMTNEIMYWLEN